MSFIRGYSTVAKCVFQEQIPKAVASVSKPVLGACFYATALLKYSQMRKAFAVFLPRIDAKTQH